MDRHAIDQVDQEDGRLVAVCACGWRSTPATTGEAVGTEWDGHAAEMRRRAAPTA